MSVQVQRSGAVATLTIAGDEASNALDAGLAAALADALDAAADDASVRAVVLRARGRHFMVGADVRWLATLLELQPAARQQRLGELIDLAHRSIERIHTMAQPVLVAVHGAAAGFGLSLVAACDLALGARSASFVLAYGALGASPDGGASFTLPRLLGTRAALQLALLNTRIDAARALQLGLLGEVVDDDSLHARADAVGHALACGAPMAQARTKRLMREAGLAELRAQLRAERDAFVEACVGDEFAEGVRAFVARRAPCFT